MPSASCAGQRRRGRGPYGDACAEIDWSTGQILDTLKQFGLDAKTLAVRQPQVKKAIGVSSPTRGAKASPCLPGEQKDDAPGIGRRKEGHHAFDNRDAGC